MWIARRIADDGQPFDRPRIHQSAVQHEKFHDLLIARGDLRRTDTCSHQIHPTRLMELLRCQIEITSHQPAAPDPGEDSGNLSQNGQAASREALPCDTIHRHAMQPTADHSIDMRDMNPATGQVVNNNGRRRVSLTAARRHGDSGTEATSSGADSVDRGELPTKLAGRALTRKLTITNPAQLLEQHNIGTCGL